MAPTAPSIREYDGPHDGADLCVADGVFVTVVNRNLTDDQAEQLGYSFDPDVLLAEATFAHRRITVSPELSERLDTSQYQHPDDDEGELRDEWPRVGGTVSEENIVDVPESNPSTIPLDLGDGELVSPAEQDERARVAAAGTSAIQEAREASPPGEGLSDEQRAELVGRRDAIDGRLAQINDALAPLDEAETLDDAESAAKAELEAERARLDAEREALDNAIEGRA